MQVRAFERYIPLKDIVLFIAPWEIVHAFLSSDDFLQNQLKFMKYSFRNTILVSNRLDPDQAPRFVRPDLGLICLQRL